MGDTGPVGLQGEVGPEGSEGPQGEKGEMGDTGPVGLQGEVGPEGREGPQGEKGERGETGPVGLQGEVGPEGSEGPKGEKGERGDTGPQGVAICDTFVRSFFENNISVGVGSFSTAKGRSNSAFGAFAASKLDTGECNVAVGIQSLGNNSNGKNNTAVGSYALLGLGIEPEGTDPDENTALGFGALGRLNKGTKNIGIGCNAGVNYSWDESSNITLGSEGVEGECCVVRIGSQNQLLAYVLDSPIPFASSDSENLVCFAGNGDFLMSQNAVSGMTILCAAQGNTKIIVPEKIIVRGMTFSFFCLKTEGEITVTTLRKKTFFYYTVQDKTNMCRTFTISGNQAGRSRVTFLVDPDLNLFVLSSEGNFFLDPL
jgi:hypothetical protein